MNSQWHTLQHLNSQLLHERDCAANNRHFFGKVVVFSCDSTPYRLMKKVYLFTLIEQLCRRSRRQQGLALVFRLVLSCIVILMLWFIEESCIKNITFQRSFQYRFNGFFAGIDSFWSTTFKNVDLLSTMIQEHDEPILEKLTDIKVNFTSEPMVSWLRKCCRHCSLPYQ